MTSVTAAVLPLALGGALVAGVSMRPSASSLHRLGKRSQRGAHWADRRDLRPLLLTPKASYPGRLVLGTTHTKIHASLVAAEVAQSVVVVGPTQSGKTTSLAVPAILNWQGPVLAASVKSNLLQHTLGRRSILGQVWCIDPTGATSARPSTWSPLAACIQWPAALRMASDLADTAKSDGPMSDGEFWYATAAKTLAPLLFAAAHDGRSMADVVRWVDNQEAAEVSIILEQVGVEDALIAARATWCRDERTRSSIYTTAETIVAPFAGLRDSSSARFEPWDLFGGTNTVYLCAPAHDQRRLRGFFTALTQQVLHYAFSQATLRAKPLDPPLLVVLDEAAHIAPLPELDALAATCASHGIQLVTIWQDLAQVRARYGAKAPTVLNNHRAKIFLPGIADPDTLDYVSRLVGDEEIAVPSITRDPHGARSTTSTTMPRRLLPPEELRCLTSGQAVLVYGTLPPAKVHLRPWWRAPLPTSR